MVAETLVGIDYGSKLAGTTVACWQTAPGQPLRWATVARGQDADQWLLATLAPLSPGLLFFDAPLSLPGVYTDPDRYDDYFYRAGDRTLRAMSPLFLGGLTARAMRLAAVWRRAGWTVRETYPARQADRLGLRPLGYKTKAVAPAALLNCLEAELPVVPCPADVPTWHHFDALLAWLGAYRYQTGCADAYGHTPEGQIYV